MYKVMSAEQLAANRRNAQKSTGPRTREGKARAARNNTRHGFFSRDLVLTAGLAAEDHAEFDALHSDFHNDLKPRTQTECCCLETMIRCHWLARRARRYETTFVPGEAADSALNANEPDYINRPSFLAYVRFENRLDRTFDLALQRFFALRAVHPTLYWSDTAHPAGSRAVFRAATVRERPDAPADLTVSVHYPKKQSRHRQEAVNKVPALSKQPVRNKRNNNSNPSSTLTSKSAGGQAGRTAKPLAMIPGSKASRFADCSLDPAQ